MRDANAGFKFKVRSEVNVFAGLGFSEHISVYNFTQVKLKQVCCPKGAIVFEIDKYIKHGVKKNIREL